MTNNTLKAFEFVLYELSSFLGNWLMTFHAFHVDMLAIELKSSRIVVELRIFPTRYGVAFHTIGDSVFGKLPYVVIFVAS